MDFCSFFVLVLAPVSFCIEGLGDGFPHACCTRQRKKGKDEKMEGGEEEVSGLEIMRNSQEVRLERNTHPVNPEMGF